MYITSTGMVCPVGLSAQAACAAMRAGISQFEELPYICNEGDPIMGAITPGLKADLKFEQRLVEMLAAAISECLRKKQPPQTETIPLLVGLPESERPGIQSALADRIIGQVQEKVQAQFHPKLSRTISAGHTSGFEAIRSVPDLFQDSKISSCLICGVDSFINARSLLWLDQHQRLKTDENSDGVIPGEAAAAICLGRQGTSTGKGKVRIPSLGFGKENANILSEEPCLGLGLTKAVEAALEGAGFKMDEIDFRLSDVTGESYGFREQMLVLGRLMRVRREDMIPVWQCSEFIGDTGAAVGICQIVAAFEAFEKEYSPGNRGVCYTSAVSGDRAVVILENVPD